MKKYDRPKSRGVIRTQDRQNNRKEQRKEQMKPFKGRYVVSYEGETTEHLIRRFRKVVEASGVLREVKRREYYMSKSEKARDKRKKALKRLRKRQKAIYKNEEQRD